jgi:hypothetical protein
VEEAVAMTVAGAVPPAVVGLGEAGS